MKKYDELEMEVVVFSAEDVIDDSYNSIPTSGDMGPWLP